MTTFTLSSATQAAINNALNDGPGTNNANYLAAYNDIYNDLVANGNVNPAVVYWFSQAGGINSQEFSATAAGTFIWNYTIAAAASEGATLTIPEMQTASNDIAHNVFQTLKNASFSFDDATDFSMASIVRNDAGTAIGDLQADAPNLNPKLDFAIWGGTLFARTNLQDPTYFTDNHVDLTPGSRDANAMFQGLFAAASAVVQAGGTVTNTGIANAINLDLPAIWSALTGQQQAAVTMTFLAAGPTLTGLAALATGGLYLWNAVSGAKFTFSSNSQTALPVVYAYNSQASSSAAEFTSETVNYASNGSGSFTDMAGDQIASYTTGQLTGGTIKINGSEIDVDNSAGQILNSTQDMSVGSGAVGVLDNVYSGTTAGVTKVNAGGQDTTTAVYVNDSGIGVAVSPITALYYYQNGAVTPLMSGGRQVLLDDQADRVFVDNKGELFVDSAVNDTLTIYSSISGGVLGTATTLSYQHGLPFFALDTISISPNGNLIMSQTQIAQDGSSSVQIYNRTTGVTQTVNLPTYTYPDGTVSYFNANFGGINDNGLIVGAYTNAIVNNPQPGKGSGNILVNYAPDGYDNVVVGGLYNSQTGSITIISDPNLQSLPGGSGGLFLSGINDSGEIVGTYTKAVNVPVINNPNNLLPGSGYSPQVYVDQAFVYNNGAYSDVSVPVAPSAVYDESLNEIIPNDTIASGVTNNGTISVYALAEPDQNGTFTISQDGYVVSPGGTVDTSTFNVVGNGTIDLRTATSLAGVQTLSLQEGQAAYTNGSTVIANTEQTVYLQNGLNATVNVASDTSINTQNPNAAGIIIFGAQDSDTINLGTGNDAVQLGSAFETVNGGGGNNTFYVSSSTIGATINGGTGQNVLDITGGGTVTMGSNITNIKTVNLLAAPTGQTQPAYNFTANGTAGLTVTDYSTGNDTLTAGNVTGDTLSVYGDSGNKTLTVQDTLSNNPGSSYNNTLNAAGTSGNNTLTVGDGSYDLLRTDWSTVTSANTLTAGNGSHDWLDAESSLGSNTLTIGSGTNNTLDVSFSSGNNNLSTVNGSSDYLDADSSTGNNTLTAGNGNSITMSASFSSGVNTLTAGNGNNDFLNVSSSTGNNILTAGNGSNDQLSAVWSTGRNTFNAGTGNTVLIGGEGFTTYKFGSSFGQDVLWNSGSPAGQGAASVLGEVDFTSSSITYENLWFAQSGTDLVVQLLGTTDTITVKGWFGTNAGAEVQTFHANGLTLSNAAVAALVSAMATYQTANTSFNPATATSMPTNSALQSAITTAWPGSLGTTNISVATAIANQSALDAIGAYSVADTAANVVGGLTFLTSDASHITSITLTDGMTPTLVLTAAQNSADAAALGKISSAYNLTISGVTAANAATVAGQAHVTSITVSDTGANVVANIAALETLATGTKLSSITLTDGTTPTLALTSTQYSSDTAALGKIGSTYNLSISGVTAANAATTAAAAHATSIAVSDTAANVLTNITALETLATGTELSSITLTDGTTPTLALTSAQYSADTAALGKIISAYNLTVSGVTAANAAIVAGNTHVTSFTVSDTGANVVASIASLETLATGAQLSSITLTDGTTPTLALTAAQYSADTAALGKITSAYNLTVSGVSGANAATVAGNTHVTSLTVSDTAANIGTNIAALETLATGTKLASVTLTDTGTPTLALTAAQYAADTAALGKITNTSYNLSISGVAAANAATTAAAAHVTSITVSDTAANVLANITTLETLATGTALSSITLTDGTTPTLALTSTQDSADSAVLGKITSAYNLTVSNVLAANAASVATQAHFASEAISDTAADFVTSISSLETLAAAGKITTIAFTDSTTPTITLTAAQQTADADALAKITSTYNLVVLGGTVTAAVAATTTMVVSVSDTAANVLTYLSQLQTQTVAGRITAITFTDGTTPTLALTAAQLTADATVLGKISSAYNLSVSGVTAANAATVAGQAHVTSISVSDMGANVLANIAALETLATGTELSSITLTDGTTPTLALTAAQYAADTAALAKIGSAYNLSISGVTAANASTVAGAAHVTAVTVSDTAANVLTNMTALETLATGTKLSSIALTDGTTPTLSLTATQYAADAAALGKISSAYNLSISGVTAANASTIAGAAHVTSVTVSDTAVNVVTNIAALQSIGSKLSSITLTDSGTPTLSLTAAQFTADSAAVNKISSNYVLSIAQSGVNFNFAPNTLVSIGTSGSTNTYTVNSAAVGYTETISWASGGKAILTLTNNATSQSFASSLGWPTSGQSLQISGSLVTVYNSSAQAMNATQVNANGSQADINYDLSGGTWATNTYYYDAAGNQTEIGWTNNNGTASASFYNPALSGDPLEVNQNVNANGSGTLSTANSQSVTYAAGDTPTISFGATGDNIATFTTNSGAGPVDVIDMGTSAITTTVGSNRLVDNVASTSVSLASSGNVTLTSGGSTLTEATNGTDTFVIGSDTISLAASAVTSVLLDGSGAYDFALNSVASGYGETLDWNPNTGKAILVITNLATSATFATSLSYIDPGDILSVTSGASLTNANSSAQAMYTTLVNADGSQDDISYDTTGGTWKDNIYYYSAAGVNTEVRYDNNNGTLVDDFYNSGGTLIGQTIYNGDSILHSNNSNVTGINTTGMTTLDVTGSTSVTAAELSGFTSLTNGSGSTDTIYATTAGTYSIAGKTVTGNFNLSATNTTANVNLTGNNQAGQVLIGGAGADTLAPGTGNDTLDGGTGYTAYSFGTTFGQDTINNAYAGNTTAKGEIDFASGITDEKLWFAQSGNNLVIDLLGTTDQITVSGWFGSNTGADVQTFNAGSLKLDTQVAQLVQAMASYATAHSGFNPQTATAMPTDTTLQNAITAAWHS